MNIGQLVGNKYNYKSISYHRNLNTDSVNGILASGYIVKNTNNCNNIDMVTKNYHGVLVLSGTAIHVDDKSRQEVGPGDFIQRIPHSKHTTIITSDNYSELYVLIGKNMYEELVSLHVLTDHSMVLHPGLDYETVNNVLHIQDQLGFVDQLELNLLVPQFIDYLARITYLSRSNNRTTVEKDILALASSYILDNLGERITCEDVAIHVNLGYEKFRKLFSAYFNMSPGNYIIHKRINKAQSLLTSGDFTITDVAYTLGYSDTFTFSKQFKKVTGRTPSDFQKIFIDSF